MSFLAIFVAFFLEYRNIFSGVRSWFRHKISDYAGFFVNRDFNTVREIRIQFILAMLPFIAATLFLMILPLTDLDLVYYIVNAIIFIMCVETLSWRKQAKKTSRGRDFQMFVQTFATRFFAATFWFIVLPSVLGTICYLTLTAMGNKLRARSEESMVYSVVVDKMLFWINIVPYSVLTIFIAIAGDFEEVMHYILSQRGQVKVSFFYLENVLNEVAFLAIGKDKFARTRSVSYDESSGIEDFRSNKNIFDPKVVDFVVALLYRSGLFFVSAIVVISLVGLF